MKTVTIAVLALMALSLASCGRRGPLEVPPPTPEQQARAAQAQGQSQPTIRLAPNDKPIIFDGSGDDVINAGPDAAVDGEPFLLDPLLN